MKDSMRKRLSLWRKKGDSEVWNIGDSEVWKIQKLQKTQQRKVRKRTNVGGWPEDKVETVGGTTEARRKHENGWTEVRNREEVPAFMQNEKDGSITI